MTECHVDMRKGWQGKGGWEVRKEGEKGSGGRGQHLSFRKESAGEGPIVAPMLNLSQKHQLLPGERDGAQRQGELSAEQGAAPAGGSGQLREREWSVAKDRAPGTQPPSMLVGELHLRLQQPESPQVPKPSSPSEELKSQEHGTNPLTFVSRPPTAWPQTEAWSQETCCISG